MAETDSSFAKSPSGPPKDSQQQRRPLCFCAQSAVYGRQRTRTKQRARPAPAARGACIVVRAHSVERAQSEGSADSLCGCFPIQVDTFLRCAQLFKARNLSQRNRRHRLLHRPSERVLFYSGHQTSVRLSASQSIVCQKNSSATLELPPSQPSKQPRGEVAECSNKPTEGSPDSCSLSSKFFALQSFTRAIKKKKKRQQTLDRQTISKLSKEETIIK